MQGIFDWHYILPGDRVNFHRAGHKFNTKAHRSFWFLPSSGDIAHKARQLGAA
jgi:hypothetical protein